MKLSKPIKNVKMIHFGQRLFQVKTSSLTNDAEVKKDITPDALKYAAIEIMEVEAILPNETRTGLLLSGRLVNKKGEPLYPDNPKKSFVDHVEVPFDQENVIIGPGAWFDIEEAAQDFARTINMGTRKSIQRIKETFTKFQDELDDYIKNGV